MTLPLITPEQIAIICPTKDRPGKVKRMLKSIVESTVHPGQVLIADGGHNLAPITKTFEDILNITCLYCPEPGQILQRNFAHQHLNAAIRLVIHMDDDITTEKATLSNMLTFWNDEQNKTPNKPLGGVSFNLVDLPVRKNSIFLKALFLSTEPVGSVSVAGGNARLCPTYENIEVEWLLGGATAWARDVIDGHKHPMSFKTRWATCEDVMFSYPMRSSYRMMVAASATMLYNDEYNQLNLRQGIFYGVSDILMRYYFICQHQNLSALAFLWMNLGVAGGYLACAITGKGRGKPLHNLGLSIGHFEGLIRVIFSLISSKDQLEHAKRLAISLAKRKR